MKKIILLGGIFIWFIVRSICWNGELWDIWSDGYYRYWFPRLDKNGCVVKCSGVPAWKLKK